MPPSTTRAVPVVKADSSLARYTARAAISPAVPTRPMGWRAMRAARTSSVLLPEVEVERNCRIRRAVIDRGCRVPQGTVIGEDPVADARRFRVTEKGIVLVTAAMFGQEPTISQT